MSGIFHICPVYVGLDSQICHLLIFIVLSFYNFGKNTVDNWRLANWNLVVELDNWLEYTKASMYIIENYVR